jgi:hypothetical protein
MDVIPQFFPTRCAFIMATAILSAGCEQTIEVDLPDVEPEIVVEGRVETGLPPFVTLSLTSGYFEPLSIQNLEGQFLGDATLTLTRSGGESTELVPVCTGDLSEAELVLASEWLGIPPELLAAVDLCIYTSFDPNWTGAPSTTYHLEVERGGEVVEATTRIPEAVPMDSIWFESPGPPDSLGIAHAIVSDPDTLGNAYRWFARRINRRPAWDPEAGEPKDADFIAPLGSVIDDAFFNSLSFEFTAFRGSTPGSTAWDDDFANGEAGYFKRGDTVVVKTCTIDREVYLALASYEALILGQGSPFSIPSDMVDNIVGGRGLFAGYAASLDTVIFEP